MPPRVNRRVPDAYSVPVSAGPISIGLFYSDHVLVLPADKHCLLICEGVEVVTVQRGVRELIADDVRATLKDVLD